MTQETYISRLWHKVALVAASVCVAISAFAADPFPNEGTLIANTEYELSNSSNFWAAFYPSTTGEILFNNYNVIRAYTDSSLAEEISADHKGYEEGGMATLRVTKGVPVYFGPAFFYYYTGVNFRITENAPIQITGYSTQEGNVLSMTDGFGSLQIYANQPVHAGTVVVSVDGTTTSKVISTSSVNTMTIEIPYLSTLESWYNTGVLQGGENITFTISGIVNAAGVYYNGGRDLVLKYKAAPKTVKLREAVVPNPFMSYWTPGDPAAVLTANYSGNISKAAYYINFGNQESEDGDYYEEFGSSQNVNSPAKFTINGSTVKIDFSGKQRRPQDMVPSGTNYNNMTLKVIAWDESGNPVVGEGAGQVGSFDRALNYQYIAPAEFNQTFTPEPGESLKGQKTIEIHLFDYNKINFTGVKFEIEGNASMSAAKKAKPIAQTIIVPKSDITVKEGSNFDCTLTIPVPEAAQNTNEKVIVTLADLTSTDGIDHTNDIRVVYNGFTITTFDLYNPDGLLITDRTLTELPADSKIEVMTNVAEQYPDLYMEYEILDIYNGQVTTAKSPVWLKRIDDGFDIFYQQEVTMAVKMVRGHEYHIVFTAWPSESDRWAGVDELGSEYFVFYGATEPFSFSSIQLVSVTPENETTIEPDQTEFTLEYDGLVEISKETSHITYGMGQTVNFAKIEPIYDEEVSLDGYSNKWMVTIPDSYIANYRVDILNLCIVATDENGKLVEGNEGDEETNYLHLSYPIAGAGTNDDFYVLPGDEYVESLYEFTVGCDSYPISLTYNDEISIVLYNMMTREPIYSFTSSDVDIVTVPKKGVEIPDGASEFDDTYYTTVAKFTLPNEIVDKGAYSLNIPEGFFSFGSQFDVTHNADRSMQYEILGEPDPVEYTTIPAEGSVKELKTIVIKFEIGPSLSSGKATLVINGGTPIELNDPDVEWPESFDDLYNTYTLELPETYTADGTYEIIFPKGYFAGMDGDYPEIRLTYIIGETGINAVFGDAETINVFTIDGRQVVNNGSVEDIKALAPGFYIINGRKVVLK